MFSRFQVEEFYFVASNEHAAEVIGRNGWKIKLIALKTRTNIKCPTPIDAPIFCISGRKNNVQKAKSLIKSWADNFDRMKVKKRSFRLNPGDSIDTVMLNSFDVPAIIGKQGKQIKKIAEMANVKIVSPDINKEPIFIISGKDSDVETAIFWIKLTAFCLNGTNFFSYNNVLLIQQLLQDPYQNVDFVTRSQRIVNFRKLNQNFHLMTAEAKRFERRKSTGDVSAYNCCYCKEQKFKVAKGLCGHVISCDLCIVRRFQDLYLRCHFCKLKIENFLIENYLNN